MLQTSAFSFYVVFLFLGMWIGQSFPRILEPLVLALAWVNMVYGLAFIAVLGRLKVAIPTTGVPLNGAQASGVALIGLLTVRPRTRFYWYLVAGNVFVLLAQQKRAEWFGFVAAVLVFAFLTRRIRPVVVGTGRARLSHGVRHGARPRSRRRQDKGWLARPRHDLRTRRRSVR